MWGKSPDAGTSRQAIPEARPTLRAIENLKLAPCDLESHKADPDERDKIVVQRGQNLVGIFKSRYLRRLESSGAAFRISVFRLMEYLLTFRHYILDHVLLEPAESASSSACSIRICRTMLNRSFHLIGEDRFARLPQRTETPMRATSLAQQLIAQARFVRGPIERRRRVGCPACRRLCLWPLPDG